MAEQVTPVSLAHKDMLYVSSGHFHHKHGGRLPLIQISAWALAEFCPFPFYYYTKPMTYV